MSHTRAKNIQLRIVNPDQDKRWNEFVIHNPKGTIYHHSDWGKVLQSTYNHKIIHVALENTLTGDFEGATPFMLVKSKLTGNRLVSLPFTSYCDPLAEKDNFKIILNFILENYSDLSYIEVKTTKNTDLMVSDSFKRESSYVTHIINIEDSLDNLFKSFHKTSVQQRIKRAERENLKFRVADQEDDLKKFYHLESEVRKKHGLPPPPYRFFRNMWRILKPKDLFLVPLVEYKNKVIAGAVLLKSKNTYHFEYSASDQRYLKLCPNQKLIWETIKIARSDGAKYFDLGRSSLRNHSLIKFKERWAARGLILNYYYCPSKLLDTEKGFKRLILERINTYLPIQLLKLEGKLMYRHLS